MAGWSLAARYMNKENLEANIALDKLFKQVSKLHKDIDFLLVKVDNCTLYIPINKLDESMIPEFRTRFKEVYERSREGL